MADFLKIRVAEFYQRYARRLRGKWSLNETRTPHGHDCVFLSRDERGRAMCDIYPVRPQQCRTWPFWAGNLASREDWDRAAQRCPGMNQGKFFSADQIRVIRDSPPPGSAPGSGPGTITRMTNSGN